ncbi:MAG: hypothetical protein JST93_05615 [Acidobacteria bacterium]|nr:hypothetical protein [Acidobacteriota bacterium]
MDCNYKLEIDRNSRPPVKEDDQFTLVLNPALKPTCRFHYEVEGPFKEAGRGAAGQVTFKATDNNPKGRITFFVACEDPRCEETRTNSVPIEGVVPVKDEQTTAKKVAVGVILGTSVVVGVLLGSPLGPAGSVAGGAIGAVVGSILSLGLLQLWK